MVSLSTIGHVKQLKKCIISWSLLPPCTPSSDVAPVFSLLRQLLQLALQATDKRTICSQDCRKFLRQRIVQGRRNAALQPGATVGDTWHIHKWDYPSMIPKPTTLAGKPWPPRLRKDHMALLATKFAWFIVAFPAVHNKPPTFTVLASL